MLARSIGYRCAPVAFKRFVCASTSKVCHLFVETAQRENATIFLILSSQPLCAVWARTGCENTGVPEV